MRKRWKNVLCLMVSCTLVNATGIVSAETVYAGTVKEKGTQNEREAFQVLKYVNQERKKAGLSQLIMDQELVKYAQRRSNEITLKFDHIRPDGSDCFTISDRVMGENIAMGFQNARQVMDGWMNSSGHRQNILRYDYQSIGVSCFRKNGKYYWVQLFGTDKAKKAVYGAAKETSTDSDDTKATDTTRVTKLKNHQVKVVLQKKKGADGYRLEYSTNKNFAHKKVKKTKKNVCRIEGLKSGKTYYFRAQAYDINEDGKKVYDRYSKVEKIKL